MKSLLSHTNFWTMKLAGRRTGLLIISAYFFLDSSIFPFPTTLIFITLSLINPPRSYYNALIATMAMVSGSLAGYALGHYLWMLPDGNFTHIATYFFNHIPGFTELNYHYIQNLYLKWGYRILFFSIILPVPYQFYSITAGVFQFNLLTFTLATLLFQGSRFFIFAWLTVKYGEGVKPIIQKNLKIISILCIIIILIMFLFSAL